MSLETGRRGRPKGTGIDDRDHLREVAAMILKSPDLKPTTAIKKLGFSDPSTIRRLRDKFNSEKEELLRELQEPRNSAIRSSPAPKAAEAGLREMALCHPREPAITETAYRADEPSGAPAAVGPDHAQAACVRRHEVQDGDLFVRTMLALGLAGATTATQFQTAIARQFLMSPFIHTALRLQIAATQAMFGLGEPQLVRRSST